MTGRRPHVVVVGGGIAGLAAAHRLVSRGAEVEVTLLESDQRLGGKIRTEHFAGRPLDVGAEALLARVPAGIDLCREVGLGDALVAPVTDQAYVWTDRLRPLPPRLMAGVPGAGGALVRSGILSPAALARAGLDLVLPARPPEQDVSIGSVVRRRLGGQVLERLVDPLLGGIHAGSCDDLSMRATAPQLQAALGRGHGLVRGLRALSAGAKSAPAAAVFLTLRGGLQDMVSALGESLGSVDVRTGTAVAGLERAGAAGLRLTLAGGEHLDADRVILAVPAFAACELLERECPEAAEEMRAIRYASVATIALSYPPSALEGFPPGSGFLVSRGRGSTITACTWSSQKWAQLTGDSLLLKCSVGHAGDRTALDLDDERLLAAIRSDLSQAMGLDAEPLEHRVFRFERALPQYAVGHLERMTRIEQALDRAAGVSVCGAAYRGVGVASCIRDGQSAADASLLALGAARDAGEASPTLISQ
jgi:oxygen-dependent protoporphyrinogen oxidase